MKLSIQTDNLSELKIALDSECTDIRFGSEFCEYAIPSTNEIAEAYEMVKTHNKGFKYVTPRVSNSGIKILGKHFDYLDENEDVSIIFNDLGILNLLRSYENLSLHLGRQLIRIPARSPWIDTYLQYGSLRAKQRLEAAFSSTSLNFDPTLEFYWNKGVRRLDLDWLPRILPSLKPLIKYGYYISIHLDSFPISVARRCHTARFLGEKSPSNCSKQCKKQAFLLQYELYDLELMLQGNTVFQLVQLDKEDSSDLEKAGVTEFIVTMNPLSGLDSRKEIDNMISFLS